MSSQRLDLLVNANGDGVSTPPIGSGMQWFGGKARIYIWAATAVFVAIEVSPDGGTTWIQVFQPPVDPFLTRSLAGLLSEPAILIRARSGSTSTSQNLNVTLIGYDDAE